jgi:arylsulfatase A-like enzyme/Tfp pilus assembly protein PilF
MARADLAPAARRPIRTTMPRMGGRLLSFAAIVAVAGCASGGCRRAGTPARDPSQNVLLITIDTLRADALGAYGNASASTPAIDRLAAEGVRFDQAHASTVVTLPSHATILSGVYPFHHGVRENAGFRFPASAETLATLLHARGYRTGAFVSAFPLDARFGLTRGFDVYDDRFPKSDAAAFRVPERKGRDTVQAALAWMTGSSAGAGPWLAWVHLYEPHFPYAPPEPYASRYQGAPYLGEVAAADAAVGMLVDGAARASGGRATLVVLTGDHGESLGEHGEMTHGLFAYEGTLRVPLIIHQPRAFAPRVVTSPARHVDVLPTILDAVGAPVPSLDGASLLAEAAGADAPPRPSYFESLSASLNRGWAPLYGVARGSLKYVELPIPELYDLAADRSEAHNVAAARPAEVRELQRLLEAIRGTESRVTPAPESADTRERLRALGYVTSATTPKARYTEADDPKTLVAVDRQIEEVVSRYQRGDLAGAIALGERVVHDRPDMPLSLVHLAFLYNEAGRHDAAAASIRHALALNPTAMDVAALAGAYLTEAGRAAEAVRLLAPYAAADPPDADVLNAYGVALATAGRKREALDVFTRAGSGDHPDAMALANAAAVHLETGDRTRAAALFREALAADPTLARAHNGLGVIAAESGEVSSAVDHWRHAVALDPHDYQALFNLGDLLARNGRRAEARQYWTQYLAVVPPGVDLSDRERIRRWLSSNKP